MNAADEAIARSRLLGLLGLAFKAGAVAEGTDRTLESVRAGTAKLIIMASDVSGGTAKKLRDKASFYKTSLYEPGCTMTELGAAFGKPFAAAAAVTQAGFAAEIIKRLGGSAFKDKSYPQRDTKSPVSGDTPEKERFEG